jgi:hypothetical protein
MTIIYDLPELWDAKSRATIDLAAQVVGTALAPYTGLDPAASFEAVFGTVHVRFTSTLATWAHASYGVIRFRNAKVIYLPLVVHELGHLFIVRAKNRPTKQLWGDKVDTITASPWPGMHPPSLKGYNVVEQFVNAWESWIFELYVGSEDGSGFDLYNWMDSYMPDWCALAMGVSNVTI